MILGLLLAQPAHAIELSFWGVGPTLSTIAIPGKYPWGIPGNAKNEEGEAMISRLKGDVEIGVHGVAYPSAAGRLFGIGNLGFGNDGWRRQELVVGWDHALIKEKDFHLLFGVGVGAGGETFPQNNDGDGRLRISYFPLRGQLNAVLRDKSRAYELGLYASYHIASDQAWYPSEDAEPDSAELLQTGFYAEVGAQATVYFGDFRTNKEERRGKNKGKKG